MYLLIEKWSRSRFGEKSDLRTIVFTYPWLIYLETPTVPGGLTESGENNFLQIPRVAILCRAFWNVFLYIVDTKCEIEVCLEHVLTFKYSQLSQVAFLSTNALEPSVSACSGPDAEAARR